MTLNSFSPYEVPFSMFMDNAFQKGITELNKRNGL
jgi:hypothetical protein